MVLLLGCSKEEKGLVYDSTRQGKVTFELVRTSVYTISALSDAHTIKVTLRDMEGKEIVLPSMVLSGNEDRISTEPYPIDAGIYEVINYKCYDMQADLIEELDITLTEDNVIEVEAGEELPISLPTYVKKVLTTSNLYNSLFGICLEILGDDEDLWPKSWDFASGEIDIFWAGLEFDTDERSNPTDVIGLVIDGSPQYIINSDTGEELLVSLPEFKDMKVLPGCISNLQKLTSLVVRNCALEEIPAEIQYSYITSLSIENTNLAYIPKEMGKMEGLTDVEFKGNKFTEFPEELTDIETIEIFTIDNERISEIPESIEKWGKHLVALNIRNTDISSLPDVFDSLWHVSTLDVSGNKNLSTLPQSIGMYEIPYGNDGSYSPNALNGIYMNNCAFTDIPAAVQRKGIRYINMTGNKITQVTKEQIEKMEDLETLVLDGNKLTSFPKITNPNLTMLSLIDTGLTRDMVDLSGLPKLNPRYVFFTKEDYKAVFGY